MRMPSCLVHQSCDSLARSVFLHAGFFQPMRFLQPFSSFFFHVFLLCEQFFSVFIDSSKFFCVCFLKSLSSNMPRNTLLSVLASLDPYGPASSTSGVPAPSSIACEQALLFGRVKRVWRERASERRSRESPFARAFSRDSLCLPK